MSMVRQGPMRDADAEDAAAGSSPAGHPPTEQPVQGDHLLELWSDRQEIHALPEILRPAEGLVAVGSGTVLRSGRLAQSRWLVVLTDRRLLCIKGRHPVTRKVIDMPVSAVRSVATSGMLRKTLALETGYGTLRISGMKKSLATDMVQGLTALTNSFGAGSGDGPTAIRRVELPGQHDAGGASAEAMAALEGRMDGVQAELSELKDQIAFLEGLVRGTIESKPTEPTELE